MAEFHSSKQKMKISNWNYSYLADRFYPKFIDMYDYNDVDVLEIKKGRYDYAPLKANDFPLDELSSSELIKGILEALTGPEGTEFYFGLLESQPGSETGNLHRDSIPLEKAYALGEKPYTEALEIEDLKQQNYYFTVLIPLMAVNETNGSTLFIPGSHRQSYREMKACSAVEVQPELVPGDVVIFSGTTLHRGGPNRSAEERTMIYQVWQKTWFEHKH